MSFKEGIFKASAPGSLMLLGEYAVLYNKPALVCAVDKRMTVTLKPRSDQRIELISEGYGRYVTSLSELEVKAPFQFVTACLTQYRKKLKSGCEIYITSEFSDQLGFGSSAAVTVATLAALFAWLELPTDEGQLIREGRRLIRDVQTVGSGADVAASVVGGVVAYRASPLAFEKFSDLPPLTVIYSGSKTPTVEAIRRVKEKFSAAPALFNTLCQAIHHCAKEGIYALHQKDWSRLGSAMNVQQGLMQSLGVSTPLLDDLIERLRADTAIMGAKISGSGWGDCVLGLGRAQHLGLEERYQGVKQMEVQVTPRGVEIQ
jgi:mevalonate kinase